MDFSFKRRWQLIAGLLMLGLIVSRLVIRSQAVDPARSGPDPAAMEIDPMSAEEVLLLKHLETLAKAALEYEAKQHALPAIAIRDSEGKLLLSWRVSLLPFLGEQELYDQFHLDEPWDSEHNRALIPRMPQVFLGPLVKQASEGKTGVVANPLVFRETGMRLSEITDGTRQTAMLFDGDETLLAEWTRPQTWTVDLEHPWRGLWMENEAVRIAFCDGKVVTVISLIGSRDFATFLTPSNGDAAQHTKRSDGAEPAPFQASQTRGDEEKRRAAIEAAQQEPALQLLNQGLQMRRITLAALNYEAAHGHYPARAIVDAQGKPLLSWRVSLLPYLGQEALYDQFHLDEPWDSPHNQRLIAKMPTVFKETPFSKGDEGKTTFLANPFVFRQRGMTIKEVIDGTVNVVMLLKGDASQATEWTRPQDWTYDPAQPWRGLDLYQHKRFLTIYCDSAAHLLSNEMPVAEFEKFLKPDDGEMTDRDLLDKLRSDCDEAKGVDQISTVPLPGSEVFSEKRGK